MVLALLDDDCISSLSGLAELVAAVLHNPEVLARELTVQPSPETASAAAGQVITEVGDTFFNPPGREPCILLGLNFALNRERCLDLGGCVTDFGFLAVEDCDFIDGWQRAGGKLLIDLGPRYAMDPAVL